MITGLEITNEVLRSSNWPTVTTIEGTRTLTTQKAIQGLNHVGLMLGRYIYWRFLHTRARLLTIAKYKTGTVAVTQGSPVVTGTSTVWTPDMVGRAFKINSYEEEYRIGAVLSVTEIQLETEFTGDTGSSKSYVIAQDRYLLPEEFDSELNFFQFLDPKTLSLISPERFDEEIRHYHLGTSELATDHPRIATIETDGFGRSVLILGPHPKERITITYSYYRQLRELQRDEDFWPFPLYLKPVLHDGTLHYLSRDAKSDGVSQMQLQEFFDKRSELAGLTRMADQTPRFQPDTGLHRRARNYRRGHRIRPGIEDEWPLGSVRI